MLIEETEISGVLILTPRRFGDDRGYFEETWNATTHADAGLDIVWKQDNQSLSRDVGTLRGLHFQVPPRAQAKLVRVISGEIWDVAVDIRKGSATYGRWVGVTLTGDNGRQLLIPAGFAHGFVTRQPDTIVSYKCSDTYAPDHEGAVCWDDPTLAIDWKVDAPILSDKDAAAGSFDTLQSPFTWGSA